MQVLAGERHADAQRIEQHAHTHHRQGAKTTDQVTGKKSGREHANHVPFEHDGRVLKTQAALLHGQRRGGHQQVHHAIAQGSRHAGHHKHWLAQHLQRTAARTHVAARSGLGRLGRKGNKGHQHHRQQRHHGQRQVGPGKRHVQQAARARRQVGPHDGAQQTAGQHQRHRPFARGGQRQLGGGKAVQLPVGTVITRHHRRHHQPPKLLLKNRPRRQQGRQKRHQQTRLKRHLAPPAPLAIGHQRRAERRTHHIAHHRQRRHPPHRRQPQTHQAVDGDKSHVVG